MTTQPTPQPAGDALHVAICNAVILLNNGEEIAPRVSAILREALFNYTPDETARAIQAGKGLDRLVRVGDLPAPITNPEAWPTGYADGFNDYARLVEQAQSAALAGVPSVEAQAEVVGAKTWVLTCPNCPTSKESKTPEEFEPCPRCGTYMDVDPTGKAATTPDPAAPDGDDWIEKLRRELLRSKMTHNFTFSRDEVIELLGGMSALSNPRVSEADTGDSNHGG